MRKQITKSKHMGICFILVLAAIVIAAMIFFPKSAFSHVKVYLQADYLFICVLKLLFETLFYLL